MYSGQQKNSHKNKTKALTDYILLPFPPYILEYFPLDSEKLTERQRPIL